MISKIHTSLLIIIAIIAYSCDKADLKANRLHNGSGRWLIESLETIEYNPDGSVLKDSKSHDLGEFVFFSSPTLDALYDYYPGVENLKDTTGNVTSTNIEYYIDGDRADLRFGNILFSRNKPWTVDKSGTRKQIWFMVTVNANNAVDMPSLTKKEILTLKKTSL